MKKLVWTKLNKDAKIPKLGRNGDAGRDLWACFPQEEIYIPVGGNAIVPTGVCTKFDPTVVAVLKERGSTGFANMALRAGICDSNYTGEYLVMINNTGKKPIVITKDITKVNGRVLHEDEKQGFTIHDYNKAIAQILFLDLAQFDEEETVDYEEYLKLTSESERGDNKLGSSDDIESTDTTVTSVTKEDVELGNKEKVSKEVTKQKAKPKTKKTTTSKKPTATKPTTKPTSKETEVN